MRNCIFAITYELLLHLVNLLYLSRRQPYLSVKGICPFVLTLGCQPLWWRHILEQIGASCCWVHKIAMHRWKHRVHDLLEVIFKVGLSLPAISANSTLNQWKFTCKRSSSRLIWSMSGSSFNVLLYSSAKV